MTERSQEETLAALRAALAAVESSAEASAERVPGRDRPAPDDEPVPDAAERRLANRALSILSGRDHSRFELRAKLLKKDEVDPDSVERVLDKLADSNLLDDERFAAEFVRSKHATRGLGRSALQRELKNKGVAEPIISTALDAISTDDERATALALARKKASTTTSLPYETRQRRLLSFLARRGYRPGLCLDVVNSVLEDA